jgi:hypothetical protein
MLVPLSSRRAAKVAVGFIELVIVKSILLQFSLLVFIEVADAGAVAAAIL